MSTYRLAAGTTGLIIPEDEGLMKAQNAWTSTEILAPPPFREWLEQDNKTAVNPHAPLNPLGQFRYCIAWCLGVSPPTVHPMINSENKEFDQGMYGRIVQMTMTKYFWEDDFAYIRKILKSEQAIRNEAMRIRLLM